MRESDEVRFVLQNGSGYALIALQDRVLIVKFGIGAGATFGSRTASLPYKDISGISTNTGMMSAVLEIHTAAHQATSVGDYWGGLTKT